MKPEPGRKPPEQAGPLPRKGDFVQRDGRVTGDGKGHSREADADGKAEPGLAGVDPYPVPAKGGSNGGQEEVVRQGDGDNDGKDPEEKKSTEDRNDPPAPGDSLSDRWQRPSAQLSAAREAPREGGGRRLPESSPTPHASGRSPGNSRTVS